MLTADLCTTNDDTSVQVSGTQADSFVAHQALWAQCKLSSKAVQQNTLPATGAGLATGAKLPLQ